MAWKPGLLAAHLSQSTLQLLRKVKEIKYNRDIRNMAEEEEQASVEEVAQQQPEEKVVEVKVGKFQFTDGSWYEGEYVVDGQ